MLPFVKNILHIVNLSHVLADTFTTVYHKILDIDFNFYWHI